MEVSRDQVSDIGKCQKLKPKEEEVISALGKKSHFRYHEKDVDGRKVEVPGPDPATGHYKWRNRVQTNDGLGPTKGFQAMCDLMKPFVNADVARFSAMSAVAPREKLYSKNGVEYVDPAQARVTANRNGWKATPSMWFVGTGVLGEWCPKCDLRKTWCECSG